MRKKLLTAALAATMVVGSVFSAFAASFSLVGTAWWASGNQASEAFALADGASVSYTVKCDADVDGYAAFVAEVRDDVAGSTHCITTASDGNGWYFVDGGTTGDTPTGLANIIDSEIIAGSTYKVTFTRNGGNIGIQYFDVDSNTVFADMKFNNTNLSGNVTFNFSAQVGTFTFNEVTETDGTTDATTDAGTTDATTAAGTATSEAAKTGDASTTATLLLAVAAIGASMVVLATKKSRVTE